MPKKIILISLFLTLSFILIGTGKAMAATSIIDPSASAYAEGNYTLNDILSIAIGASRYILGIVGSLTLIMFIYGGFTFLISGGSSEKVGQAKKIIVAAVIGLLIVFSSYLIIKFVLASLGLDWNGKAQQMTPVTNSSSSSNPKTCSDLGQSYSCMLNTQGTNCQINLCLNGSDKQNLSIQCCQPK